MLTFVVIVGNRHVEGVANVLHGGADLGELGQVADRLREDADVELRVADDDSAGPAAAELFVPLHLDAVAFLLADDLVGADDGGGTGKRGHPPLKKSRPAASISTRKPGP